MIQSIEKNFLIDPLTTNNTIYRDSLILTSQKIHSLHHVQMVNSGHGQWKIRPLFLFDKDVIYRGLFICSLATLEPTLDHYWWNNLIDGIPNIDHCILILNFDLKFTGSLMTRLSLSASLSPQWGLYCETLDSIAKP